MWSVVTKGYDDDAGNDGVMSGGSTTGSMLVGQEESIYRNRSKRMKVNAV